MFFLIMFIASTIISVYSAKIARLKHGYVLDPLIFPVLIWYLNYPVRLLVIGYFSDVIDSSQLANYDLSTFSNINIGYAFFYYILFILAVFLGYILTAPKSKVNIYGFFKANAWPVTSGLTRMTFVILLGFIISFIYKIKFASAGLYDSFSDLKVSFIDIFILSIFDLYIFLIALLIFHYSKTGKKFYLFFSFIVGSIVAYTGLLAASKGVILVIAILFLALFSLAGIHIRRSYIIAASIILLSYAAMTSIMRSYGTVRGGITFDVLTQNFFLIFELSGDIIVIAFRDIANRMSYYGDALVLLIGQKSLDTGMYFLGSIIELLNFIPSAVWDSRPHLSFNHHLTYNLFGMEILSETPIGRIGESFYVLKYFGILYGFLYGIFFGLMSRIYAYHCKNIYVFCLWFFALFVIIFPDAYLTYNIKRFIITIVVFGLFYFVSRVFFSLISSRQRSICT